MNKSKLKVGYLYCGGCNPLFDREWVLNTITTAYNHSCEFLPYISDEEFDLVLLINGCKSECLFDMKKDFNFLVINEGDPEIFLKIFQTILPLTNDNS